MIIDSHTHIGKIAFKVGKNRVNNLPEDDLITAMKKYKIDFALVSGLEGSEYNSDGKLADKKYQVSQDEEIKRLVHFTQENYEVIRAMFWGKPFTEGLTNEVKKLIEVNRKYFCGIKLHPSLSGLKFTDKRFFPYLELAADLDFPVQVHTENDGLADIRYMKKISSLFPHVKFIMVHMGLGSDNTEAIDLIRNSENVYGDTCVVSHANVMKAIKECGSGKILFGSDAVVNGIDTYMNYMILIKKLKETFSEKEISDILYSNCSQLYHLSFLVNKKN